jgi:hypothetical protein
MRLNDKYRLRNPVDTTPLYPNTKRPIFHFPRSSPYALARRLAKAKESVATLLKEALVKVVGETNDSTLTGMCKAELSNGFDVVGRDNLLG